MILLVNQNQLYPNAKEASILNKYFNNKKIRNAQDIIWVQNKVVNEILQKNIGAEEIKVERIIAMKSGQCYDRSLLLQKYFVLHNFRVRPIYLFWTEYGNTSLFDIFDLRLKSHAIFEICLNNSWYVIRTNTIQKKLETLDMYLGNTYFLPKDVKYIKHLSNRNGRFIKPSFLPDIY